MFILVRSLPSCYNLFMHKSSTSLMVLYKTTLSDLVQISPEDFQKLSSVSIKDNINAKYANKVGIRCLMPSLIF